MSEGFAWGGTADGVVFKSVQGVAVYSNLDGDIVIRQQAGPIDDDDAVIIIPRDRLDSLLLALRAELEG